MLICSSREARRYPDRREVIFVSIGSKRRPRAKVGTAARSKHAGRAEQPQAEAAPSDPTPDANVTTEIETSAPAIGPSLQAHIGKQLRAAFQSVLAEPVPPRFVELLESLGKKTTE